MALIAWVIRIAAIINQFNLSMKFACTFNLVVKAYSYTVIKKDLNTPDTVLLLLLLCVLLSVLDGQICSPDELCGQPQV